MKAVFYITDETQLSVGASLLAMDAQAPHSIGKHA